MTRFYKLFLSILTISFPLFGFSQNATNVNDDFEGSGTISTWAGDNCGINTSKANPHQTGINTSATVLEYSDVGGQYANVRFDVTNNFDLSTNATFSLKIYVPTAGLTGSQTNQISLKLQDGTLGQPWDTQSEIIKTISLDQWQTVTFDFANDTYVNLDPGSPPPTTRTDFNRIVIQVNGENNNDHVLAYIDDVEYLEPPAAPLQDDFEGGSSITWVPDACGLNTSLANPQSNANNNSATVLEYHDTGGQYANIRFDKGSEFDLSTYATFSLKIYVPSSGITGSQTNQISLKLQDSDIAQPWTTQTEIIKTISLDQWQTITFDFLDDPYTNADANSAAPTTRNDLDRVLIQVNGENNTDQVKAYIDDFLYDEVNPSGVVYDNLVWQDEFNIDGAVNATNWFHQTQLPAGGSWYNSEVQHYTNRTDNAVVENGVLKIIAKAETYTDQGYTKDYTSARLNSKFAFKYGKVEIRAKMPSGTGTWPALWMLGQNITESGAYWETQGYGTTTWPDCGEIDIMEHWGHNHGYVSSALHTPSSNGNTVNLGHQTIPTVSSDFHIYTVEWTPTRIKFSFDGVNHYTYSPTVKDASTWPFDANQYILFNVAMLPSVVGTGFVESAMEVDYIRIYQETINVPVELTQFYGETTPQGNQLYWETASEEINKGFEIQRSTNGENWDVIGFKEGAGTTLEPQEYQFLDEAPLVGKNYYRLKQLDLDGKFEYSNIVELTTQKSTDLKINLYPNPTNGLLQIEGLEAIGNAHIDVIDFVGKTVMQRTLKQNQLDISVLPKGSYMVRIISDSQIVVRKIIKR